MKLFIIGPSRGYPNYNIEAFKAAAAHYRSLGHTVTFLMEDSRVLLIMDRIIEEKRTFNDFEIMEFTRWSIEYILWADKVIRLPHWETSEGVKNEVTICNILNISILDAYGPLECTRCTCWRCENMELSWTNSESDVSKKPFGAPNQFGHFSGYEPTGLRDII